MEIERIEKPLRQMRKLLKHLTENPSPEQVHRLRTRARKVEAIAGALAAVEAPKSKQLLKAIKPLRKAAGAVRDMDVLTGNLLALPRKESGTSLIKLEEHLGATRKQSAGKLLDVVDMQRSKARRRLKRYAEAIESATSGKKPVARAGTQTLDEETGTDSRADHLADEIARCSTLSHNNLHAFRLKVKELRYVLQLLPYASKGLVDVLGKVKDQIGEWHDWEQLLDTAREVLDPRTDRELLQLIEATSRRKFMQALAGANGMRQRYFNSAVIRKAAS